MLIKLVKSFISKPIAVLLAFSMMLMSFTTAPLKAEMVVLKSGTPIALELMSSIQSNNVKSGQIVDFRVINDVKVDDKVVIPAGSIAKGQIVSAKKNGLLGTAGEVSVTLKSVAAVDGTVVPLTSSVLNDEGDDKLVVSIVLTLLCFFGFLMKGGKAELSSGAQVQATVLSNTEISLK